MFNNLKDAGEIGLKSSRVKHIVQRCGDLVEKEPFGLKKGWLIDNLQ